MVEVDSACCPGSRPGLQGNGRPVRQQDQRLVAFLLGRATPPNATQTRAARLGPFAYTALPADHPGRLDFRTDYLKSVARHLSIKAEVALLIAAWRDAGIEALLWKGFYLAEFVYPTPGTRFHGDVDVLLRPHDLRNAARIAAELGWAGGPALLGRQAFRHAAYELVRPGGATLLDIHRYVLHRPAQARFGRSHAWVELEGEVLPELREWQNPTSYRVNFRYPERILPLSRRHGVGSGLHV